MFPKSSCLLQRKKPNLLKSSALVQGLGSCEVGGNGITVAYWECELVFL